MYIGSVNGGAKPLVAALASAAAFGALSCGRTRVCTVRLKLNEFSVKQKHTQKHTTITTPQTTTKRVYRYRISKL